jgi:DNA-binding NtrC family response regulator
MTLTPAILIAEDDPRLLVALRCLLRAKLCDYAIIATICGEEMLPILESRPVALVITDYGLPGLNGLEFAAEIKARSPQTPVILISGESLADEGQASPSIDGFLQKPFSIEHLLSLAQSALERSKAHKQAA